MILSTPHSDRHSGFSLLEVMVALLLFFLAALGLLSLQLTTMNAVHNSDLRLQAQILAQDLLERLRVDGVAVDDAVAAWRIQLTRSNLPQVAGEFRQSAPNGRYRIVVFWRPAPGSPPCPLQTQTARACLQWREP